MRPSKSLALKGSLLKAQRYLEKQAAIEKDSLLLEVARHIEHAIAVFVLSENWKRRGQ